MAVVDSGRELAAFGRDDDAILVTTQLAIGKAYTACSLRRSTLELNKHTWSGSDLHGLETAHDPPLVCIGGGVPLRRDERMVGAQIGVSGGKAAQDHRARGGRRRALRERPAGGVVTTIEGKRAVFLGGATGIGAAAIGLFAEQGARIAFGDIQEARAQELVRSVESTGAQISFRRTDATVEDDVAELIGTARDELGGIDILVSVAGIASASAVEEMPLDMWDRVMDVNARSCFLATKHAVPLLRDAGGGVIVNTASIAGLRGMGAGSTHYAASKGAVIGFTRALAAELAPTMSAVNCICPGHTRHGLQRSVLRLPWRLRGVLAGNGTGHPAAARGRAVGDRTGDALPRLPTSRRS